MALMQYRSTSQSRVIEFALMLQQNTLAFFPLCLQREIKMIMKQHIIFGIHFWLRKQPYKS